MWPLVTEDERNVVPVPEGDVVVAMVCGNVCPFVGGEGGGDVTVEMVSVT